MAAGFLEVGAIVRHLEQPDWGEGQVQSIIGLRVTVNFVHQGKVVLHGEDIPLEVIEPDDL